MAVLLVSRGSFSGAQSIAQCLATTKGMTCLTRESLIAEVNTHGELANKIIASMPNAARNYAEFSALRRPYKILMRLALLQYVRQGNVAYFGYSGHLLLPPIAHVVRVRILAPLGFRMGQLMARQRFTKEEAREYICQVDEERGRWTRFMYGKSLRDPELFDICLNLDRLSFPAACCILTDAGNQSEFQPTPGSMADVENLYLSTKVLAALVTDSKTADMEIGAKASEGRVELEGPYLEDQERALVLEVAAAVPGVRGAQYKEGYSPNFDLMFGPEEAAS